MNINIIRTGLVVFKKEREKAIKMKYRISHYGAILMADYFGAQINVGYMAQAAKYQQTLIRMAYLFIGHTAQHVGS